MTSATSPPSARRLKPAVDARGEWEGMLDRASSFARIPPVILCFCVRSCAPGSRVPTYQQIHRPHARSPSHSPSHSPSPADGFALLARASSVCCVYLHCAWSLSIDATTAASYSALAGWRHGCPYRGWRLSSRTKRSPVRPTRPAGMGADGFALAGSDVEDEARSYHGTFAYAACMPT